MSIRRLQNIAASRNLQEALANTQREFDNVYRNIEQTQSIVNNNTTIIQQISGGAVTPTDRVRWDSAYTVSLIAVTGSGTIGKLPKFVGTQAVGDSIISEAASVATVTGGLTVTGTTTLAVALSGVLKAAAGVVSGSAAMTDVSDTLISGPTAGQVLSWNGTKWTNTNISSIAPGAATTYYQHQEASDIAGYLKAIHTTPNDGENTLFADAGAGAEVLIKAWATEPGDPDMTLIQGGDWVFDVYGLRDAGASGPFIRVKVYKRTHPGGVETLLFSTDTPALGTSVALWETEIIQPDFTGLNLTDRLVFKFYAVNPGAGTRRCTIYFEGVTNFSHIHTPILPTHNDLPGLQGGTADEYYHLTAAEYTGTGTGVFVRKDNPTITTGITIAALAGILKGTAGVISGSAALADLSDIQITSLTLNDVLQWNGSKWVNAAGGGGGSIGGSGTAGTLAKFTAGTTIGNSVITESGSNITIGGKVRLGAATQQLDLTLTLAAGAAGGIYLEQTGIIGWYIGLDAANDGSLQFTTNGSLTPAASGILISWDEKVTLAQGILKLGTGAATAGQLTFFPSTANGYFHVDNRGDDTFRISTGASVGSTDLLMLSVTSKLTLTASGAQIDLYDQVSGVTKLWSIYSNAGTFKVYSGESTAVRLSVDKDGTFIVQGTAAQVSMYDRTVGATKAFSWYVASGICRLYSYETTTDRFSIDKDGNAQVDGTFTATNIFGTDITLGTAVLFDDGGGNAASIVLEGSGIISIRSTLYLGIQNTATGSMLFWYNGAVGSISITPASPGASSYAITLPANNGYIAIHPTRTGNAGKVLAVKAGEAELEWISPSAGTLTENDLYRFFLL